MPFAINQMARMTSERPSGVLHKSITQFLPPVPRETEPREQQRFAATLRVAEAQQIVLDLVAADGRFVDVRKQDQIGAPVRRPAYSEYRSICQIATGLVTK